MSTPSRPISPNQQGIRMTALRDELDRQGRALYRHFKGAKYVVLRLVNDATRNETAIEYIALDDDVRHHTRTPEDFFAEVEPERGAWVPRFLGPLS